MPIWLLSALGLLRTAAVGTTGRALVTGTGVGAVAGAVLDDEDEKKKRRRRRRALTASDKADIAFVVGLMGAKAGKDFTTVIATRAR